MHRRKGNNLYLGLGFPMKGKGGAPAKGNSPDPRSF